MKRLLTVILTGAAFLQAQAQLINPQSVNGTAFGALAGGIIGNQFNHQTWQGAAIGAGSGFLLGNIANKQSQPVGYYYPAPNAAACYPSYGYSCPTPSPYAPNYAYPPVAAPPAEPTSKPTYYPAAGAALGGIVGGIIGNQVHHQTWEGAAIGAGAGLLLGGIADQSAQKHERRASPVVQYYYAPQPMPSASQCQITSQPCPSSTYYWTSRPQIPDAPRVPDARTF